MTLFGFCIEITGTVYEVWKWGSDVADAFGASANCYRLEHLRLTDKDAEWEGVELATYTGACELIWWLDEAEA